MVSSLLDIDTQNLENAIDWGDSPLHFLARWHHADILPQAIKVSPDINVVNKFQQTPLLAAAHACYCDEYVHAQYIDTFQILLEAKADHTCKDEIGRTVPQYMTGLILGFLYNDMRMPKLGVLANSVHGKSFKTKLEIVRLLMQYGANCRIEETFPNLISELNERKSEFSSKVIKLIF